MECFVDCAADRIDAGYVDRASDGAVHHTAGRTADGNVETFARRRATELKHGRISMLATMGYITPEITGKFSGFLSPSSNLKFADIPNGLGAVSKVPAAGWTQIVA